MRIARDAMFLKIAEIFGERATCNRGKSGAVLVKDRHIIAAGYVGAPPGFPHCDEAGHDLRTVKGEDGEEHIHCTRTIHAETNAILQSASFGISCRGATLYCHMTPCKNCAMLIVGVGIIRVVCNKRYHSDAESLSILRRAGIEVLIMNNVVEDYPGQKTCSECGCLEDMEDPTHRHCWHVHDLQSAEQFGCTLFKKK